MSVGHSARRKLGGPEMYRVPMREFNAGLVNGKSKANDCCRRELCAGFVAALWAARDSRMGHCYTQVQSVRVPATNDREGEYLKLLLNLLCTQRPNITLRGLRNEFCSDITNEGNGYDGICQPHTS